MKKSTINAVISKKVNDWLNSITDIPLRNSIKDKVIVTGGCITSMLLNEPINDFDVYLTEKESVKKLAQYYCDIFNKKNESLKNNLGKKVKAWVLDGEDIVAWKEGKIKLSSFAYDYPDLPYTEKNVYDSETESKLYTVFGRVSGMLLSTPLDRVKVIINSDGIAESSDEVADEVDYSVEEYLNVLNDGDEIPENVMEESEKYRPIFLSSNAITLSNKVQLIIRFYGDAEKIHENFDFVHTKNYWTFKDGVVLNPRSLEAILNKELFYTGSKYPIASIIRTRKFLKRGWQINAGQYLKMAFQINNLNLNDIYVLEDQLVGVDSIYFLNFIRKMKEKYEEGGEFNLEQDYVVTVIDKVFK